MTHYWRIRKHLPERYLEPCRILAEGRGPGPRNVLVQFADGKKYVTSRWSVRPIAQRPPPEPKLFP